MSGSQGMNITSYLLGNQKAISTPYTAGITGIFGTTSVVRSSLARILSYILAIIIILLVILLFIHFFIKPIFKLHPGAPGIIPVPGTDDGKLYWNRTSAGQIMNKDLPIANRSYGYSMNLDIFIQNPLQFSKHPRILFSRGAIRKEHPEGDTLLGILSRYNIVSALLPDTNDMIVSVLNKDYNMENIIVPNVPIQEPFRLGVILMESALEVYINGHLMKTKTFMAPPLDVHGDIYPASGIEANMALVRNLKLWPRILTTSEIRYATPSLSTAKDFGATPMPTSSSTSCSTQVTNVQLVAEQAMDRFNKLSVDSVSDTGSNLLSSVSGLSDF